MSDNPKDWATLLLAIIMVGWLLSVIAHMI